MVAILSRPQYVSTHDKQKYLYVNPTSWQDTDWYIARNIHGEVGMIPNNYVLGRGEVKALPMPWVDINTSHPRVPTMDQ